MLTLLLVLMPCLCRSEKLAAICVLLTCFDVQNRGSNHVNLNCQKDVGENILQSLNSPFFPRYIGVEPRRAKRKCRITCMRMLRTLPLPTSRTNVFVLLVLVLKLMSIEKRRCKHKHKRKSASCFTVSRRYGAKNKAIIHSAHAYVLMLVLRTSSIPLCLCLCSCLCRSENLLKFDFDLVIWEARSDMYTAHMFRNAKQG